MLQSTLPELSLSFWPLLFLAAGGQALFYAIVLWLPKFRSKSGNIYLGWIMALFAFNLFFNFSFWTNFIYQFPHIYLTNVISYYCFAPLFLLYLDSLSERPRYQDKVWLHFVPAAVLAIYLVPFLLLSAPAKLLVLSGKMEMPSVANTEFLWIFTNYRAFGMQMLLYLIPMGLIVWKDYSNRKQIVGAGATRKRFIWFATCILLYIIFVVSFLTYFPLSSRPSFSLTHDFIISGIMTVSIYSIGVLGHIFSKTEIGHWQMGLELGDDRQQSLNAYMVRSILDKLDLHMTEQKPFLQIDLRLHDLANSLGISSHLLSELLNKHLGKSFNTYINEKRIEEAKIYLADPDFDHMPVYEIGLAAGFNNKTTFSQFFKKSWGQSPGQFRKQIQTSKKSQ